MNLRSKKCRYEGLKRKFFVSASFHSLKPEKKYWGVRRKCVEAFSKKENVRVRTICNALGGSELIIQVFDSWGSSMRSLLETWTLSDFLNRNQNFSQMLPVTCMHINV